MDESVIKHLKQPYRERVLEGVPMKLSEAIRIGAKKRPQCSGTFFNDYGESCAMGAAMEVMFGASRMNVKIEHLKGATDHLPNDIYMDVISMNDGGVTREQIADWLEAKGF